MIGQSKCGRILTFSYGEGVLDMENWEDFSEIQVKVLERFVTNTQGNVFALRNLPEVIKGALFSRYSRSSLGLRSLLLKEFIQGDETEFNAIVGRKSFEESEVENQFIAIKKAQNFYDRILDGYGDDSIGELGGAHLAIENVSMLAAKAVENSRIGGSPLEKSTRYIYFDQKVKGQYLYYREPILMTSAYRELYLSTCDHLFSTYSDLIGPTTELMEKKFPKDPESSKAAYTAAIRAKSLDCLRGLLPAGTLTNMGVYGNGRFWEYLLHKLQCDNLTELQEVGKNAFEELSKVIPSFVRRAEGSHYTHESMSSFFHAMSAQLKNAGSSINLPAKEVKSGVQLIDTDKQCLEKIAAALLFTEGHHSLETLREYTAKLSNSEISNLFDAASSMRENRRHKPPRALEHAEFTFEIVGDFGAYRDLHRHRILTQERQLLTADFGYYISSDILDTPMEKSYREAIERAKDAYDEIRLQLPEEAQYVVPMAFNVRWYFKINLRALVWLTELRSTAAGHPSYRYIAQRMARLTIEAYPELACFFKFVDYDGYDLGRLGQEEKKLEKKKER